MLQCWLLYAKMLIWTVAVEDSETAVGVLIQLLIWATEYTFDILF